jgi:hypothetical protein
MYSIFVKKNLPKAKLVILANYVNDLIHLVDSHVEQQQMQSNNFHYLLIEYYQVNQANYQ